MTDGGTYVLELNVPAETDVSVGALGAITLSSGRIGYVGSALGPGGFSRIDRHYSVAAGQRATRHWHIDYLLGLESISIVDTYRFPAEAVECEIADMASPGLVPGFGCSDCGCSSHLFELDDSVRRRLNRPSWGG